MSSVYSQFSFIGSDIKYQSFYVLHLKPSYVCQQHQSSGQNLNRFSLSLVKTVSSLWNWVSVIRHLKSRTPEGHLLLLRYSDKESWNLARLIQCSNSLLMGLTVTSGCTDAEFQKAIIILREVVLHSCYHATTSGIRKRRTFCTSLPAYVFLVLMMKFLDHVQH